MGVWSDSTIANLSAASDAIKTLENLWTIAFGSVASTIIRATSLLANFLGMSTVSALLAPAPAIDTKAFGTEKESATDKTQDKIYDNLRKQLDIEDKIAEKGMTQEQIAKRLLNTYSALSAQKKLVESFKTEVGDLQASQLGVEMAQIKERLSGMGGSSGSMQVLADSLQQVGGGGNFAQVGSNTANEYLRAIKDSSAISARSLQNMVGNNRGSVTPVGAQ
jgi:hypothetical protein